MLSPMPRAVNVFPDFFTAAWWTFCCSRIVFLMSCSTETGAHDLSKDKCAQASRSLVPPCVRQEGRQSALCCLRTPGGDPPNMSFICASRFLFVRVCDHARENAPGDRSVQLDAEVLAGQDERGMTSREGEQLPTDRARNYLVSLGTQTNLGAATAPTSHRSTSSARASRMPAAAIAHAV